MLPIFISKDFLVRGYLQESFALVQYLTSMAA